MCILLYLSMQKIQKFAQNVFVNEKKKTTEWTSKNNTVLKTWSDCRPPSSEAESIAKVTKFVT